jgi:hypothetical protein
VTNASLSRDLGAVHHQLLSATDRVSDDQKAALHQVAEKVAKIQASIAYKNDVWFYRSVVIFLGSAMLLVIIGIIILNFHGTTSNEALTAIGSAAVGALAGIFAPSPVGQSNG